MHDDELLDRLRAYVRENRGTYTAQAIRDRLIKDGAPKDAVDRVLAEEVPYGAPYGASYAPAASQSAARGWPVWPFVGVAALSLVGNFVIMFVAVIVGLGSETGVAAGAILILGMALEIAGATMIGRWARIPTTRLLVALALTPLAVAALMLGACFVMFN